MNSVFKNALVWVLLGSALIFIFNNVENASSSKREMISYSQFKQEVLSDRVAKVTYKGDQMTIFGERLDGTRFETRHPIYKSCLLYTSPSPRDRQKSRMPSSA